MIRREYQLFADYFQFHLQDDDIRFGDLSKAWTQQAIDRRIAVAPGVVGVRTARNVTVPVVVEVLDKEPMLEIDGSDHIAEAGLDVTTGRIVVAGCTDYFPDADRITVLPGSYRVRLSCWGLGAISSNGLKGKDRYRVQLWPSPTPPQPVLIKQATTG